MPNPQPPYQPPQVPPPPSFSKPTNFPDFLITALSLFLFITAPKHHLHHHHHIAPRATTFCSTNRRYLRLTSSTMSQSPNRNSRLFPTPQSLSDWLKPRLPSDSFATWGIKPGTKNVHNLWLELEDGEVSLLDKVPPIRNLEVVCVRILNKDGKLLIESKQELSDGSIRVRNRPLSEKLKSGEDIESGVKRAVKEELGSVLMNEDFNEVVKVKMESYERKVEERNSVSYPGLPACYVLHYVDAVVEGLPEGEFITEEGNEYEGCDHGIADQAVEVKKHFWKWVDADFV